MKPIRVTYNQACELLSITRDTLSNLTLKDPIFPKPYKYGNSLEFPVYFDYTNIVECNHSQKANAAAEA